MGFTEKKKRPDGLIVCGAYLLLIVLGLVFVWYRKLENLPNLYLINIGVDIFGMLMGFVLFIACMIDVQKTGSDQRYFCGF